MSILPGWKEDPGQYKEKPDREDCTGRGRSRSCHPAVQGKLPTLMAYG